VLVGVVVGLVDAPRRYATLVVRPDRRSLARLGHMTGDPVRLAGMVASALALALVNGLVVLVATRAFGASAPAAAVLLVGLLIPVAVVVAPTPDGAGLVEASLVVGLIWAGVGAGEAVATMVLVRLVTFWIPMLPGWIALRRLERDRVL
jgi:glycosyltransferase 2 family protein